MPVQFVENWLSGPGSTQFYCRTWPSLPNIECRATVVFAHGYAEHVGRYEHVFPKWSQRGVQVFAFDLRGFGRTALDKLHKSKDSSYGKTSGPQQREDIDWAIRHARSEVGELPLFLMGHSMGSGRILDFVTFTPTPASLSMLSGVVLSGTFLLLPHPAPAFIRWLGRQLISLVPNLVLPTHTIVQPEIASRDPRVVRAYHKDPLAIRKGTLRGLQDMVDDGEALVMQGRAKHWPSNLPVLIIHGTSDKVALYEAAQTVYKDVNATDKTFISYPEAYHELLNEPDGIKEKVIEDCITWVEKHLEQA